MSANGSGTMDLGTEVSKNAEQAFVQIEGDFGPMVEKAKGLAVKDEATQAVANDLVVNVVQIERRLEERRTFFTAPLNQILKGINESAKKRTSLLVEAKRIIATKLDKYLSDLERERQKKVAAQQVKTEKAIDAGKPLPNLKPIADVPKTSETASGSKVTMISRWKYEIIGEVPRSECD